MGGALAKFPPPPPLIMDYFLGTSLVDIVNIDLIYIYIYIYIYPAFRLNYSLEMQQTFPFFFY